MIKLHVTKKLLAKFPVNKQRTLAKHKTDSLYPVSYRNAPDVSHDNVVYLKGYQAD